MKSFESKWKFHHGEIELGNTVDLDDSTWREVDLPHDWSIEGVPEQKMEESLPFIEAVSGTWRFHKGDNENWKEPDLDDRDWQEVALPARWEEHSAYTEDRVYGWFRKKIVVPAGLDGGDVVLVLGKIDDVDDTYLNGHKIGSTGKFPPDYQTAWAVTRKYRVPKEFINVGSENVLAVRVYDDTGPGGITEAGWTGVEGPFDADCPGESGAGYLVGGTGWYRKSFTLPKSAKGKHVFLRFDGVYMNSDVWINEHHLGNHPYGYTGFEHEITPFVKIGKEENVVAVRVQVDQPCSRWYSGAGIYRHVDLVLKEPVHIPQWGTWVTTREISGESAAIRVRTRVSNRKDTPEDTSLETEIVDENGKVHAKIKDTVEIGSNSELEFDQALSIADIRYWSTDDPYLYQVVSKLKVGRKTMDTCRTPLGIRTIRFTKDQGFFLNEKHVEIKGVCNHHDLGCLGAAVNRRAIQRQLEIMKHMGCNAIRTSHNPPAPELLDLCDSMGFLVMDEIFDEWKESKTVFGYGRFFDEWSERDLKSMLHRDRNHPSVIMWSIGNEINEQGSPNAYEMSKRLADICRAEDPTRPTTSGCNNPAAAFSTGFATPLDVVGINYNIGVYKECEGKMTVVASETASAVSTRGEYNLALEDGRLTIKRQHNQQCTSYDLAAPGWGNSAEICLKAMRDYPWIAGEFVWTGFDYIGEPTPYGWPSRSSYFGIVDLCGFPKDRFYIYQSRWTDKPMVHVLPHWNWKGYEGLEIPVWCYSNCDSVELSVNGKSLGVKTLAGLDDLHLEWMVPYEPGTLKAVAKKNGHVVCTKEIHTAGDPAKIVLGADRTEIEADGNDLSFVTVRIEDAEGHPCPNADNSIEFELAGKGEIAGLDNGDPTNHEHFKTDRHKAFHGLCLAVVKSSGGRGKINIKASAEGLESGSATITAK